ncbi:unnamed protein product [Mytilus coruscus]|uniref:Uncharacterized protein n=1 Tax=Mytilus coruscus TaxID=42192 RepID=A0A6J8ASU5_MYTCO|nr:unnamed protein product [Mytilus coruscus]
MAWTYENNNAIDECNDTLDILGHANRKVNITRRELMKPEMYNEYIHLCAQSVKYASNLFGDDVQKGANEIEDCSKISLKFNLVLESIAAIVDMGIIGIPFPYSWFSFFSIEGEAVESHLAAGKAVAHTEVVVTVLEVTNHQLNLHKTHRGGEGFRTKAEPRK